MLARTWPELAAGLNLAEVTKGWGVPARTWRRWNATGRAPQHAVDRLIAYRYGVPVTATGWDGFIFREGNLWTPENCRVTAGDVRALPYLTALNKELQAKLATPQQWRLC